MVKRIACKVWEAAKAVGRRVRNEPAMVGALIVAVGNLVGTDLSGIADQAVSVLALVIGFAVRQQVTPVRKLDRPVDV